MIAIDDIVSVLLCAGQSKRFGSDNKLLAQLGGRPLVTLAADTLSDLPFKQRIAVLPPHGAPGGDVMAAWLPSFELAENDAPEAGHERSIRIGMERALKHEPEAVLIALADMPFVEPQHLRALARAVGPDRPAASQGAGFLTPPCIFPKALCALIIDGRAPRALLHSAGCVAVPSEHAASLADIDTRADLDGACETYFARERGAARTRRN